MVVPAWWLAVSVTCFLVVTLGGLGLLAALSITVARMQQLVTQAADSGLPRALALAEQVSRLGAKVDQVVERLDREAQVALPKVESVLDRVDHAMEIVETQSERVSHAVEGAAARVREVGHHPVAATVIAGAGGLAAAGVLRRAAQWLVRRNGHIARKGYVTGLPPGRTLMELPQIIG